MNQREKIILVITAVCGLLGVAVTFLPEDFTLEGLSGGEVAGVRASFRENFDVMMDAASIKARYERVKTQLPEKLANRTPEATFSDEVTRMLKEAGWNTPTVKPARQSPIPDVNDYYYIDLDVSVAGPYDQLIKLLLDFQKTGLLIKGFDMDKPNMDRDEVRLNMTVARLAPLDPKMAAKMAKKRRG